MPAALVRAYAIIRRLSPLPCPTLRHGEPSRPAESPCGGASQAARPITPTSIPSSSLSVTARSRPRQPGALGRRGRPRETYPGQPDSGDPETIRRPFSRKQALMVTRATRERIVQAIFDFKPIEDSSDGTDVGAMIWGMVRSAPHDLHTMEKVRERLVNDVLKAMDDE